MADDSDNIETTSETEDELPPLTLLQERFAEEYIVDLVGTRALYRAGYRPKNQVTARSMAYELTHLPQVARRIDELLEERAARTRVTADRVIEELAVIGFSNLQDYIVTDQGKVALTPGAPASAARAVQKIKRKRKAFPEGVELTTVEIQLHDKGAALRALLEHVEPKAKHVELTGPGGGPIQHAAVTLYMPNNRRGGPAAEGGDGS